MKTITKLFLSIMMLLSFFYTTIIQVNADELADDSEMSEYYEEEMNKKNYIVSKAVVTQIISDDTNEVRKDIPLEADIRYQYLKIKVLNGPYKGEELELRHTVERIMPGNYIFKPNDKILLRITEDNNKISTVKIEEKVRDTQLYLIISLFILLVLIFAGMEGFKTILSLIFTLAMIFFVYIPMIIKGYSPILSSILISIISIIVTLFIISGNNLKTYVSILGTSTGVIIAGLLACLFGNFTQLTGLAESNAISLAFIPQFRGLDYKGLLFGTMLIGAIGAIMDVSVSISSSLWELCTHNPKITKQELIKSGFNIGKDILASMSNTLILAYVGTALPLVILFIVYQVYFVEIINLDSVASEIVRAMAGSIGLIACIPITVLISANIYKNHMK